MKTIKRIAIFFVIGGIGYAAIELLWRGRTHPTMVVAGGVCFVIFSWIAERFEGRSLILKAALCATLVTAVELVFGVVFNMMLGMQVWDYSNVPFNLYGQICPSFSALWGLLGLVFIPLAERLNRVIA